MTQPSQIAQLIESFRSALEGLGLPAPSPTIERWSVLVHRAMNLGRRRFHTTEHVLMVTRGLPPLPMLAGLFHDLVYVQIDDGFPAAVQDLLVGIAEPVDGGYRLAPAAGEGLAGLCAHLFDVQPGQVLGPFTGINEYLSACVALKALEELLDRATLAEVAACIEATIPFRSSKDGRSPYDALAERLSALEEREQIGLTADRIERCVGLALDLANRDVENFADADPGSFLTNTWALLPETNRPLTGFGVYSIVEYRKSLGRMEGFLNNLDPSTIFHQRVGRPSDASYSELHRLAVRNVDIARRYLGVKLFTIGVVEAFAKLTGGDAPIALFMGDIREDGVRTQRAEDQLPPDPELAPSCDPVLLDLLHVGRTGASHFDMQNSPLSSYLYRVLGEQRTLHGLDRVHLMFDGTIDERELLASLDQSIVSALGHAFASMVPTRREGLLALCP